MTWGLVPFIAFSEYGPGPKGAKPLYWFDVPSRPITSFAGIWRPLSEGTQAFAFLTSEPNNLIAPIHPKAMPVLLHEEDEARWLAGELDERVAPLSVAADAGRAGLNSAFTVDPIPVDLETTVGSKRYRVDSMPNGGARRMPTP